MLTKLATQLECLPHSQPLQWTSNCDTKEALWIPKDIERRKWGRISFFNEKVTRLYSWTPRNAINDPPNFVSIIFMFIHLFIHCVVCDRWLACETGNDFIHLISRTFINNQAEMGRFKNNFRNMVLTFYVKV